MEKLEKKYSMLRNFLRTNVPILIVMYIVMVIIFTIADKNFLTIQNLKGVFNNFAFMGFLACGVMVVMIAGGFDLSVGSISGLVGLISAVLTLDKFMVPTPLIIIIAIVIGCLAGLINGLLITKVGINPIITTLGTLAVFRGVSYFWTNQNPRITNVVILSLGRKFIANIIPYTIIVIIVLFIIISLVLKFTRFGRNLFTIGGNETIARLVGIPVDRIKIITYVISGFFSALAGLVLISQLGSARPEYGTGAELEVVTIIVLGGVVIGGGKGDFLGIALALLIIGSIANGMVMLEVPIYLRQVIKGILLVVVISMDAIRNKRQLKLN